MALVNCPECGRENVSDSAEMCPSCGYNVKEHFLKIEQEKNEKRIKQELEEKRVEQEKELQKREKEKEERELNEIKMPPAPPSKIRIWCAIGLIIVIGAFIIILPACMSELDMSFFIFVIIFIFLIILFICYIKGKYDLEKANYEKAMRDFEAYKRNELYRKKEEEKRRMEYQASQIAGQQAKIEKVKCPYCNSYNTSKIGVISRGVSIGLVGMASSKIGKQWHCNNCNSDF